MKEKFTTQIIVTQTRATSSGRTRSGTEYTLYQVIATKPSGEAINLNLRAFEDLPKNEVIEVDAELYRSQQYGDSYTLTRKGSGGGGGGDRIAAIEARLTRIEDFLSGRGEFRGTAVEQTPQQAPPQPPPAPPPIQPDPPSDFDF